MFAAGLAIAIGCTACFGGPAAQRRLRTDALEHYRSGGLGIVGDDEARERVAFIQRTLDEATMPARIWRYGWLTGFGVLAVASGIRAVAFGPEHVAAGVVGMAGSTLGVASVLLNDEQAAHAADDLRAYMDHTNDPWSLRLRVAEQALHASARVQVFVRSWPAQIGRAVVSFGSWAIIAFGTEQPSPAALNLGAGMAIGQFSMISHPLGLAVIWNRYVQRHTDVVIAPLPSTAGVQWAIVPGPIVPTLLLTF